MKKENSNQNLNEPAWPAKATKPQTVRNTLGEGGGRFTPGRMHQFQSMWVFDGTKDYKNSPTTKPDKKVY